ncbi:MAG: hypothetical protein U9Q67_04170, partial [Patescibacteria group bacterium]|nr:hypothetical protein [Patescibacteria group bacterium]
IRTALGSSIFISNELGNMLELINERQLFVLETLLGRLSGIDIFQLPDSQYVALLKEVQYITMQDYLPSRCIGGTRALVLNLCGGMREAIVYGRVWENLLDEAAHLFTGIDDEHARCALLLLELKAQGTRSVNVEKRRTAQRFSAWAGKLIEAFLINDLRCHDDDIEERDRYLNELRKILKPYGEAVDLLRPRFCVNEFFRKGGLLKYIVELSAGLLSLWLIEHQQEVGFGILSESVQLNLEKMERLLLGGAHLPSDDLIQFLSVREIISELTGRDIVQFAERLPPADTINIDKDQTPDEIAGAVISELKEWVLMNCYDQAVRLTLMLMALYHLAENNPLNKLDGHVIPNVTIRLNPEFEMSGGDTTKTRTLDAILVPYGPLPLGISGDPWKIMGEVGSTICSVVEIKTITATTRKWGILPVRPRLDDIDQMNMYLTILDGINNSKPSEERITFEYTYFVYMSAMGSRIIKVPIDPVTKRISR